MLWVPKALLMGTLQCMLFCFFVVVFWEIRKIPNYLGVKKQQQTCTLSGDMVVSVYKPQVAKNKGFVKEEY